MKHQYLNCDYSEYEKLYFHFVKATDTANNAQVICTCTIALWYKFKYGNP